MNPAVTVALFSTGNIGAVRGLIYIVFQLAGAIVGAYCAQSVTLGGKLLGVNTIAPTISVGSAAFAEMLMTFVLVMTVYATAVDGDNFSSGLAPLYIGLSVFALHIVGIPIDGTSINPARTFGASVVANDWTNQWVFWVGPITGGLFAASVFTTMSTVRKHFEKKNQ